MLYGYHPIREALRHRPHEVERVLYSHRASRRRIPEIQSLCERHGIEMARVEHGEIVSRVGEQSQGWLAEVAAVAEVVAEGAADLQVLLEDVQDPRNLGAILRVCEGAGVGKVMIRDRGSAPLTEVVARTSSGASDWLPVERVTNSTQEIKRLQQEGFWVYGAVAGGEAPWNVDLSGKVVLCLGGEENGLRRLTRESCDALIGLPMLGRIESLNVSTAAAALLYEVVRQRQAKQTQSSS